MTGMDPNPMVRALDKLLDYTASGIGAVAGPMLAPWQARREADALRIATQGEADSLRIIAAAQSDARDALVSTASDVRVEVDIAETVRQRIQFQEEKRHRNIGSVVGQTAELLGDKDVPDQEPDHDWTARFFNYIQDISSEELQPLWTKVLAGEIERPRSVSIRSLSILRNLDQTSAKLFQTLCSCCCVNSSVIDYRTLDARVLSLNGRAGGNSLREFGLQYGNLNILNEHSLIVSDYDSSYDMKLSIGVHVPEYEQQNLLVRTPFGFQERYWILVPSSQKKVGSEYWVSGVALTQAGKELFNIVECELMPEYHQALAEYFASQNSVMTEVSSPGIKTFVASNEGTLS